PRRGCGDGRRVQQPLPETAVAPAPRRGQPVPLAGRHRLRIGRDHGQRPAALELGETDRHPQRPATNGDGTETGHPGLAVANPTVFPSDPGSWQHMADTRMERPQFAFYPSGPGLGYGGIPTITTI